MVRMRSDESAKRKTFPVVEENVGVNIIDAEMRGILGILFLIATCVPIPNIMVGIKIKNE